MRYYIVKQGDTIDTILNKYGITYQNYINLNGSNIAKQLKIGDKIKIGEIRILDESIEKNINSLYERKHNDSNEQKYICPHCKNIIVIPK